MSRRYKRNNAVLEIYCNRVRRRGHRLREIRPAETSFSTKTSFPIRPRSHVAEKWLNPRSPLTYFPDSDMAPTCAPSFCILPPLSIPQHRADRPRERFALPVFAAVAFHPTVKGIRSRMKGLESRSKSIPSFLWKDLIYPRYWFRNSRFRYYYYYYYLVLVANYFG